VSIYDSTFTATAVKPAHDWIHYSGFVVALFQLGIAAIPCGLFGDLGDPDDHVLRESYWHLLRAVCRNRRKEKWACRKNTDKTVVLTRGNGAEHAIVIIGNGKGLDLEDLAAGPTNVDVSASLFTRIATGLLTLLWILLLLISAAGEKENTCFLLAVGGLGILRTPPVAGWPRHPSAFGIHLTHRQVIGHSKVMDALFKVEEKYPHVGASMLKTFFPGKLRPKEKERWGGIRDYAQKHDDDEETRRKELERVEKETSVQ
jgi:hypothetical protein